MSNVNWQALLSPTLMRRNAEGNFNPMVYPQFPFGIPGEKNQQFNRMPSGYTLFNMVVRELRYGGYLPDRPATHITQYEVRDALLNPKFGRWEDILGTSSEWVEEKPPVTKIHTRATIDRVEDICKECQQAGVKDPRKCTQILRTRPNESTNYYVTETSWNSGKLLEAYPYPRPEFRVEKEAGITIVYEELPESFRMRSQWGEKLAKFWDIMTNLPPEHWDTTLYAYALGLAVGRTDWQDEKEEHRLLTIIAEVNLMLGFDVRRGEEIYGYGLPSQKAVFAINDEITYVEMAETKVTHLQSPPTPPHNVDVSVNYLTDVRFMQSVHASPYCEAGTYKELRLREVRL
jgi:hypothetical protein